VDVEATPAQIKAVLADMDSRPNEFFAVRPVVRTGEDSRAYYAYGRHTLDRARAVPEALGRVLGVRQSQLGEEESPEETDEAVVEWFGVRAGKGQVPSGPEAEAGLRSQSRRGVAELEAAADPFGAVAREAKAERAEPKPTAGEAPVDAAEGITVDQPEPAKSPADRLALPEGGQKADKKKGRTLEDQERAEEVREDGRKYLVRFVLQIGRPDSAIAADVAAEEPSAAAAARMVEEAAPGAEMPAEEAAPAAAPPAPAEPVEGEP
jgi:hypothetical protein